MDRAEAFSRISELRGKDLRILADEYNVTVWKDGKLNKGWAGHVVERYAGLALNSSRAPNGGSWELKQTSLKYLRDGSLAVKETMAITMLDPVEVIAKDFVDSHLHQKLAKQIVVCRIHSGKSEESSFVHDIIDFDLDDPFIFRQVEADYELIRNHIREGGLKSVSSKLGVLVQARTKGKGHGSTSRAFYARTRFVAHILGLKRLDLS